MKVQAQETIGRLFIWITVGALLIASPYIIMATPSLLHGISYTAGFILDIGKGFCLIIWTFLHAIFA